DRDVPVHVVAARCGHDPAALLRNYAKRTKKADTSAASVIGSISWEADWVQSWSIRHLFTSGQLLRA
ncbi:MAG: hypothetical protein WCB75_24655, partial [Pseudolabrys sp.]